MPKLERQDTFVRQDVDFDTGEITESRTTHTTTITKHTTEEGYFKVYYDTFLASIGEGNSPLSTFLIELGRRMTYSTSGQVVYLYIDTKEEIAETLKVSVNRINQMIRQCEKLGLLVHKKREDGTRARGVYYVSPFILAKGDWSTVRGLQLSFNAQLEEMKIRPLSKPKYIEEAESNGKSL